MLPAPDGFAREVRKRTWVNVRLDESERRDIGEIALPKQATLSVVRGVVIDSMGRPASTATVQLDDPDSATLDATKTDAEGRFVLAAVPTRRYSVRAAQLAYGRDARGRPVQTEETATAESVMAGQQLRTLKREP